MKFKLSGYTHFGFRAFRSFRRSCFCVFTLWSGVPIIKKNGLFVLFCFVCDSDLSPKGYVLKADHWVLASPVEPTALASGYTYSNDRPIHSEGFILPGNGKSCSCKEFGLRGQGRYPPYAMVWLQGFYITSD